MGVSEKVKCGLLAKEAQLSIFSESYANTVDLLTRAALRLPSSDNQEKTRMQELLGLLQKAREGFVKLRAVYNRLADVVNNWPSITPAFTFIKERLVDLIGQLSEEMINAANVSAEAESLLMENAGNV